MNHGSSDSDGDWDPTSPSLSYIDLESSLNEWTFEKAEDRSVSSDTEESTEVPGSPNSSSDDDTSTTAHLHPNEDFHQQDIVGDIFSDTEDLPMSCNRREGRAKRKCEATSQNSICDPISVQSRRLMSSPRDQYGQEIASTPIPIKAGLEATMNFKRKPDRVDITVFWQYQAVINQILALNLPSLDASYPIKLRLLRSIPMKKEMLETKKIVRRGAGFFQTPLRKMFAEPNHFCLDHQEAEFDLVLQPPSNGEEMQSTVFEHRFPTSKGASRDSSDLRIVFYFQDQAVACSNIYPLSKNSCDAKYNIAMMGIMNFLALHHLDRTSPPDPEQLFDFGKRYCQLSESKQKSLKSTLANAPLMNSVIAHLNIAIRYGYYLVVPPVHSNTAKNDCTPSTPPSERHAEEEVSVESQETSGKFENLPEVLDVESMEPQPAYKYSTSNLTPYEPPYTACDRDNDEYGVFLYADHLFSLDDDFYQEEYRISGSLSNFDHQSEF